MHTVSVMLGAGGYEPPIYSFLGIYYWNTHIEAYVLISILCCVRHSVLVLRLIAPRAAARILKL